MKKNNLFLIFIGVTLLILSLSFLFLQKGIWVYLDNRWLLFYKYFNNNIITEIFYSFNSGSFYGYDKTTVISGRWLNTLISVVTEQKLLFFIYFCINFIFSYLTLKLVFDKKSSILGAFIFAFNPISFHILNYSSFLFSYSSLPILIYGTISFYKSSNYWSLFLIGIGVIFFLGYIRIMGLYLTLLIFLLFYFHKNFILFIKNRRTDFLKIITIVLLLSSTFIFSIIQPRLSGDSEIFKGVSNYTDRSIVMANSLYNKEKKDTFSDRLVIEDIILNFGKDYQNKWYYRTFMFLFLMINILFAAFQLNNKKHKKLTIFVLTILILTIFIRNLGLFVGNDFFTNVAFKYYPFLAGEMRWIFIIIVPLLSYIVAYNFSNLKTNFKQISLIIFVTVFCILSMVPLLAFKKNLSSQTIHNSDIPQDIKETFINNKLQRESTLFFPDGYYYKDGNINLSWTKNPIIFGYNENYKPLLSNNYRLVNKKQSNLWNNINKTILLNSNLENLKILGLQNIIVFNDIEDSGNNNFNWYNNNLNYTELSTQYNTYFKKQSEILNIKSKDSFNIYNYTNETDYFLYSPKSIIYNNENSFLNSKIDIKNTPLIIDPNSYGYNKFNLSNIQPLKVIYKRSYGNPTIIPIRVSIEKDSDNIKKDTSKYILHLNQTFSNNWKIKSISKEEYENFACQNNSKTSSGNQCLFKNSLFSLNHLKLFFKKSLTLDHLEGNFVGNTWIFSHDDIKENVESYFIIVYDKQKWYFILLLLTIITVICLLTLGIGSLLTKKILGKK